MAELLLVNPRARKRKSTKRRTPAQKRATAKMLAANRRRRVSTTAPSRRTKRAPSTRLKRRRARNTIAGYYPNSRRRRKYARNPSARGFQLDNLIAPLTDAGLMAAGAVGLHAAWAYLAPMIPVNLRTPPMGQALKAATALVVGGLVLPMAMPRKTAHTLTAGAVAAVITGFAWSKLSDYIVPGGADVDGLNMWLNDPGMGYLYHDDANGRSLPDYSQQPAPSYSGYNSAAID